MTQNDGLHQAERRDPRGKEMRMIQANALYSSRSELWETPQEFFDKLNAEFHFDLDACALPENAKCERFYTPEDDALKQPWLGNVWCNPPYGKQIGKWMAKAQQEIKTNANVIVLLVHARTDTRWFHDYLYQKPNVELRFVKGRLKFGGSPYNAPFPSMVAILRRTE